jgi:hypothetical protein
MVCDATTLERAVDNNVVDKHNNNYINDKDKYINPSIQKKSKGTVNKTFFRQVTMQRMQV